MKKIYRSALILIFSFLACKIYAQKKYAVLVGINEYYDKPGVKHGSVLRGCVNDVMSVRALLMRRFGYDENNIRVITDAQATKANVMGGLKDMLDKCKEGDAVFYYFSGHGMWMTNASQNSLDTAKKHGMNQAMVMSDLYSKNLDCLFTDQEVKTIFNRFVDKKAIPTAIFDCCFSGLLSSKPEYDEWAPYFITTPYGGINRAISSDDIVAVNEAYNEENAETINLDSLNDLRLENMFATEADKAVRLSDTLRVSNAVFVPRPAERPGSRFLSLSASSVYEPAKDIADETGLYHGAFTQALLYTLKKNPADISVSKLFSNINALLRIQQYKQTPSHIEDPARLKGNLLGISSAGFSNSITVKCTAKNNESILFDGGKIDGLAPGNILQGNGVTIRITSAKNNDAAAKVIKGNAAAVKAGSSFTVTDHNTTSESLIKVYAESSNRPAENYDQYVFSNMQQLINVDNFWDFKHWNYRTLSVNYFFNDTAYRSMADVKNENFFVWLTPPSNVTDALRKILSADQNVELVGDRSKADLCLYLNYVKDRKGGKPSYIFTWYKNLGEINTPGYLLFTPGHVAVKTLNTDNKKAAAVAQNIAALLTVSIRVKTDKWLNQWPRK